MQTQSHEKSKSLSWVMWEADGGTEGKSHIDYLSALYWNYAKCLFY